MTVDPGVDPLAVLRVPIRLEPAADHVDVAALMKGIEDALAERDPSLTEDEIGEVMARFNETINREQTARREAEAAENQAAGEAYLAENGARDEVTTM